MRKKIILLAVLLFSLSGEILALDAEDTIRKSQAAFLYQGQDTTVRVTMKLISKEGKERLREMTMLRKNYGPPGGEQKYFMYFFKPADVTGMSFMVNKYPGRDDDRWLFIPALNMVRRIAARDKATSFVGSDFTYEDVSGRDIADDTHELIREDTLDGKVCYVIRSTPKKGDVNYSYKVSWVDKEFFLPLKEEYFDIRGEPYRVFTADEVKTIKKFPTVTKRTMKNLQSGHRTEVTFTKVDYDIGLPDNLFSERFLKRAPKKWIK
jgi:outer membrane lipoprotein-sorting protein